MDFNCDFKIGDCVVTKFLLKKGTFITVHGWIKDIIISSSGIDIYIKSCPSNIIFIKHDFSDMKFYQGDSIDCSYCQQLNNVY